MEFEDLDVTRNGLRLKTHEPLHLRKDTTHVVPEVLECTGSDEHLSVRRPKKSTNEQKMSMIVHRVRSKTDMSKAEEKIIKSKLEPLSHSGSRTGTPNGFRSRTNSGSTKDLKKRATTAESEHPKSSTKSTQKKPPTLDCDPFRQRTLSNSSKSPPEKRKQHCKLSKQTSAPVTASTRS